MAAAGLMSSLTSWLSGAVSSAPSKFVLECTAGFHRGVRIELEPGDVRIGSTGGSDIVLRDAGIAAEHAVLRVGPQSIDLHATGGDVRAGEETVANGFGCALQLPIDLTIGEARLHISAEQPEAPPLTPAEAGEPAARRRISPVTIVVAVALLIAVSVLGVTAMRPTAQKAPDPHRIARLGAQGDDNLSKAASSKMLADLPAADRQYIENCLANRPGISVREAIAELSGCGDRQPSPALAAAINTNAQEAARKLAERLGTSGLTGLRVSTEAGQVVVAGSVTKQQAEAWTEAQQWFDTSYRGRIVLVAKVASTDVKKPAPVLNVQAAWFGERPYIITAEGNRYYKGALLDNGWAITEIADGRVLLAKDGETMALVIRP